MEENKAMPIMMKCEGCGKHVCISSASSSGLLKYQKEFKLNGQSIFLTYYDCPFCSKRHFVQIDDVKSKQMLTGVKIMFTKLAVARSKDKAIPKKQSEKFKKTRQNLSAYRTKLMKEYTGKSIHDDETDFDFVLRFSV